MDETYYSIGQYFSIDHEPYILAQCDSDTIALICLRTGNRWEDPVSVNNPYKVTQEELESALNTTAFEWCKIDREAACVMLEV